MKKIKAFFYVYIKSITSIDYYKDLTKVGFGFSFKYFVILAALAAIVASVGISLPASKSINEAVNKGLDSLVNHYPEDLEITIKEGLLSINKPEPYIVKFPEELTQDSEEFKDQNLIVFDSEGTIDDLENYNTVILVNRKNILVNNPEATGTDQIRVLPLRDFEEGTLNKETVMYLINEFRPLAKFIPYIVFTAIAGAMIFYFFAYRLTYLLVVTAILMLVGNIVKVKLQFSKYYQIGLHAMTLPLTIDVITLVAKQQVPIPLWFLLINTAIGVFALLRMKEASGEMNKVSEENANGEDVTHWPQPPVEVEKTEEKPMEVEQPETVENSESADNSADQEETNLGN
ncbi:MAG: DUF1189 family protein [Patescibacteria group bacterium]